MEKRRAEARRIMRAKIKLYQALYDCEELTEVERDLKFVLEADADVTAAITRAKRAARGLSGGRRL